MKKFLILILLQILYFSISQDNDRLVFLTTHFRHGARAPQFIDETGKDTLQEFWTNPGELTGIGQRMHYLLGLRNRLRYIKNQQFLSESFDPHEILIYSSSYNRTMVSCSSQLQGFYPQLSQKGEVLTDEQINMAYPQVGTDTIGDTAVDCHNYSDIVEIARDYINKLGGFEKLAEWGYRKL